MKDKVFGVLQRVGRSFMLPLALLPVAGLLLGIGSSFTNPITLATYNLTNIIREGGLLYTILNIMSKAIIIIGKIAVSVHLITLIFTYCCFLF